LATIITSGSQDIEELRDLVRYKKKIVADTASEKNRAIKILEDANIKLSSVLTNVDGAVGTKIITDIIEGKHNPDELLKKKDDWNPFTPFLSV
jgi:transposase